MTNETQTERPTNAEREEWLLKARWNESDLRNSMVHPGFHHFYGPIEYAEDAVECYRLAGDPRGKLNWKELIQDNLKQMGARRDRLGQLAIIDDTGFADTIPLQIYRKYPDMRRYEEKN